MCLSACIWIKNNLLQYSLIAFRNSYPVWSNPPFPKKYPTPLWGVTRCWVRPHQVRGGDMLRWLEGLYLLQWNKAGQELFKNTIKIDIFGYPVSSRTKLLISIYILYVCLVISPCTMIMIDVYLNTIFLWCFFTLSVLGGPDYTLQNFWIFYMPVFVPMLFI